ncbi:MAG: response regulator [Mycetocola sp.]
MTELRVLIVDDDHAVAQLHARQLGGIDGFTVVALAHSGAEALERIRDFAPDLVLLDVHLPDISGIEVLHRLRIAGTNGPDIIVVSSASDRVAVGQALAAGVADYLVKPFTAGELGRRLRAYRDFHRDRHEPSSALPQRAIDALVAAGTGPIRTVPELLLQRLPKGLSEPTARRVLDHVPENRPESAAWIAQNAGVSRITARRYLELLRAAGVVEMSHRYGVPGRPEQRFQRRDGSSS